VVDEQAKEALAAEQAKTFGGIMADYFAMKLAGQRSGKAIRKRIEKHQLPVFKDTPIAEITIWTSSPRWSTRGASRRPRWPGRCSTTWAGSFRG
jgi:hypothetical protein